MAISVGSRAPDFTLKSVNMQDVRLSESEHPSTVLLFFPFAFSEVCTTEFCQVTEDLNAFESLRARVLGISCDSPFALKAWSEHSNIGIDLLSDFDGRVAENYGVLYDHFMGYKRVAMRAAFVVDNRQIVRKSMVSEDARNIPDLSGIKACLLSLSRSD